MAINITPQIYISWIPNGKINITPQIYATVTFTPHVEKATADTSRNIKKLESFSADLNRKIGTTENPRADLRRTVKASENISADLNRRVAYSEKLQVRTFRKLTATEKARGKLFRQVKKFETVKSDTARKIGITTVATDLFRVVKRTENISADLLRRTGNDEKATSDTFRKINRSEKIFAETLRRVIENSKVEADTFRRVATFEKVSSDTFRKVAVFEKISADTFLKITATEKVLADTCRRMLERASAETFRKVIRPEKVSADTVIKVPHVLNLSEFVNSFKDYNCTNFEITLNERTLSDSFKLETANDFNINDAVQGMFLDYPYSFLVEETSRRDLIQSVSGMYDIDKLLYSYVKYEIPIAEYEKVYYTSHSNSYSSSYASSYSGEYVKSRIISVHEEGYIESQNKASNYVKKTAQYLGFTPNIKFKNFTPTNLDNDNDITYRDLISSLFSWTSRLPQRQINVFIRGKTLHCIQRGLEDSVFDISDIPHSRPTINKKLIRSMYNNLFAKAAINADSYSRSGGDSGGSGSSGGSGGGPKPKPPDVDSDYVEDEIPIPFSGTLSYSDDDENTSLTYSGGLLMREHTSFKNSELESIQTTNYSYFSIYNCDWYLSSKTVKNTAITADEKTVTTTNTYYKYLSTYNDIYLAEEKEKSTTENYVKREYNWKLLDTEEHTRATYHVPVGNSFYTTSVYVDGEIQGSSISQGKPGNKVSLYTINMVQLTLNPRNNAASNGGDKSGSGSGGNSGGIFSGGSSSGSSGSYSSSDKYTEKTNRLSAIDDTTFPVREIEILKELQDALIWLNRKIQVTVSVDLISRIEKGVPELKHVVDFTERILFEGKEYFLVSNNISFTPRQLIQKLQLVRWEE